MTDSQQQFSTATTSSSSTQPEAPVTSYSQLNGPTPSNQAAQTMLPQASVSVPVQNGKKRKRLQKACSACHTAKRRCSGGLPCSNCAFAGKTCRYTDSNGNAVAPPPCNPVDQPMQAAWQQQHQQQQQQQQQHQNAPSPPTQYVIQSTPFPPSQVVYSSQMSRSRAMTGSSSYGSPHTSGPLSPAQDLSSWITAERRRALLNVFFSKLHPYNSIIDELTFTRDLASDDVSPILLLSILALSAPQEENPTPSTSTSRSSSGEEFGRIARNFLFEEDYHGNTALDSPNVEIAQSLAFLSIHELSLGRLSRASLLIGNALRIVSSLRLQEGYIPSSSSTSKTSSSTSSNIKRATCIRTACLITILEVLISILSGQSPVSQISDIEILTYMSLPDSLTCSFVRLTSSVTLLSQVISAEKSSSRSNLTNGGSHSRSLSARSEADGLLRNLQSTLPFEEVFNPRNRQLNANELNNSDNGGDGESKMKSWCWTMMHSMYCISQIILEKGINSTSNSAHENLIDLLSTLGSEGRRSLIVRLPLMVASKWSRPPKPVSDWFMESNAVWGSNERNVENSLSILGLLNVNVNLGVNGGQVGSSPSNSPPISIRPLSSNTTTSPKLPPLIKSHSMNGNLPHHHHPYALHHGHSRSISNNSNPNHFLHPNSPPSLPSLRISQPDQQQTSSSSSTSQRMHSFSPGPTRPTSSSEITSPTSEIVPALSESSSTSSSTSSSSNGMNYSLSQSHQPIGTQNSTPRSMIMIEKRPNSTSPPPPFKSNTNSSNSSFGSLLHPSNDKWSPLPPLIVRGKESNVRT